MIIFANVKRVLRSQYSFFERVKFYPAKMIKTKRFENSNHKMKLLFGLIATGYRNFADLISLLSSHISSLT